MKPFFYSQTFALILNISTNSFFPSTFVWEVIDHANLSCLVPSYHREKKSNVGEAGIEPRSSCFASNRNTMASGHPMKP